MNAIKIMEKLGTFTTSIDIIAVTDHKEKALYNRAKELGAKGYLLNTFSIDEFKKCILAVVNGGSYFSELLNESLNKTHDGTDYKRLNLLTAMELKILEMISNKKNTKHIAEELFISEKTIGNHHGNIVKKLGLLPSQNSLTLWTMEHKVMIGEI